MAVLSHKVFALAPILSMDVGSPLAQGGRNYAAKAVDEAAEFGAFRLLVPAGSSEDGPVTHWFGSPDADPAFLIFAEAVFTALYPGCVVSTDAFGNTIARTLLGNNLLGALGPHQNPVGGVWTTVQTYTQFLDRVGLLRVEGTLSGDAPSDIAIAQAQLDEPVAVDPATVLDPLMVSDLVARLVVSLGAALPPPEAQIGGISARSYISKSLGLGGAIAQAFIDTYGI